MSRLQESLLANLPTEPVRVLFPEGTEPRVVAAAHRLAGGALCPMLLGDSAQVAAEARRRGLSPGRVETVNPSVERYVEACARLRDIPEAAARRLLRRRINLGAMMLRAGDADALVVGVAQATGDVLAALEILVGLAEGATVASSFLVIDPPPERAPGPLVFADCTVNPSPTAEQLAEIALLAADGARRALAIQPRVALLSFSTHGSAPHPDAERVAAATRIVQARDPTLLVDGEIQADAALDPDVAAHKLDDLGPVAGRANVLVFPDLDAANIGYKLVRTLGGAAAYGVFLQGLARPAVKVSRGISVDELVTTALLLARLVGGKTEPASAPDAAAAPAAG